MPEIVPDRQQILDLMNGFRPACVIGAAAELDVWTALADGPLSAAEFAERLGGDLRATAMLLDAVAALGLLDKDAGRYAVPPALRDCLIAGGSDAILPMLRHATNTLRGWSQLAWTVRGGIPMPRPASIRGPRADIDSFIAAMHSVSGPVADEVVRSFSPPRFSRLLDVGGASGTWTLALLRAMPDATAVIFDLPEAIAQAERRLSGTEYAGRVTLAAGDFYRDEFPAGADFAWISAICHQHSRAKNRELFAKARRALVPGGAIAIRDVVMEPSRTMPVQGALFAINMLVNTEDGGTFTFEEYAEDLRAVGFADPRLAVRHEAMNSIITARR
ncbi:MAG: methyltransferase domain-containing protein [Pirellulaceae bacterium]|nr:methyltransferase domain-containing protein [Pirellulaceae bacterium]